MPQNLRGRRFGHIRGGLRAYALTLRLLGFKYTWYEIKSRDINEKGKDFFFYNRLYNRRGDSITGLVTSIESLKGDFLRLFSIGNLLKM